MIETFEFGTLDGEAVRGFVHLRDELVVGKRCQIQIVAVAHLLSFIRPERGLLSSACNPVHNVEQNRMVEL